jgi:hypothetical protein
MVGFFPQLLAPTFLSCPPFCARTCSLPNVAAATTPTRVREKSTTPFSYSLRYSVYSSLVFRDSRVPNSSTFPQRDSFPPIPPFPAKLGGKSATIDFLPFSNASAKRIRSQYRFFWPVHVTPRTVSRFPFQFA